METLQAVDEMVGKLVDKLAAQGELDNTYFVFTSDNGYHQGQHRLPSGKTMPYEEDIKVPYVVRGPGVPEGRVRDHLVLNNDLAPTFAELGGVPAPSFVDGRSLVPLLGAMPPAPSEWRSSFLVENYVTQYEAPDYKAVRTRRYVYVRYANGARELYNLTRDPYQLNNRHASAGSAVLSRLNSELDSLKDCAGDGCRTAEGR
jgi:N-acetylglucosamine-6-sulfatase